MSSEYITFAVGFLVQELHVIAVCWQTKMWNPPKGKFHTPKNKNNY
jgi:hypothetical protein